MRLFIFFTLLFCSCATVNLKVEDEPICSNAGGEIWCFLNGRNYNIRNIELISEEDGTYKYYIDGQKIQCEDFVKLMKFLSTLDDSTVSR